MPYSFSFCKPLLRIILLTLLTAGIFEPSAILKHREGDAVLAQGMVEEVNEMIMRVMTFNIQHARGLDGQVNIDRILEEIIQAKADIVGLQEVDRFNFRSGFKDQIKELGDALAMSWTFSPSLNFGWAQYGNAILSRYPIQSSRVTVLPSDGELRTVLQAEIQAGLKSVNLYNTHLGVSLKDREQQMPILMKLIAEAAIPTIVMGDFNMEIDHPLMTEMKEKWGKVKVGKSTVLSGLEIDHIFFNMSASDVNAWTQPTSASDHDPVTAQIEWGGPHMRSAYNINNINN